MAEKKPKPTKKVKKTKRYFSMDGDYAKARAWAEKFGTIIRVRTERVRDLATPERVTGRSGQRIFGQERLRPSTAGWRLRRIFTVELPA